MNDIKIIKRKRNKKFTTIRRHFQRKCVFKILF